MIYAGESVSRRPRGTPVLEPEALEKIAQGIYNFFLEGGQVFSVTAWKGYPSPVDEKHPRVVNAIGEINWEKERTIEIYCGLLNFELSVYINHFYEMKRPLIFIAFDKPSALTNEEFEIECQEPLFQICELLRALLTPHTSSLIISLNSRPPHEWDSLTYGSSYLYMQDSHQFHKKFFDEVISLSSHMKKKQQRRFIPDYIKRAASKIKSYEFLHMSKLLSDVLSDSLGQRLLRSIEIPHVSFAAGSVEIKAMDPLSYERYLSSYFSIILDSMRPIPTDEVLKRQIADELNTMI